MSFEDSSGLGQLMSERGQAVDKMYEKTLLRWVNAKLQQGGDQSVDNLSTAWKDGTNLIRLVEILSGNQAPKYHRNVGKKSFLGLENINTAMKMLADDGLKSDISSREFQEGNQKAVLSVLWSLVHYYQLQKPFRQGGAFASGAETSRRNLFDWLEHKTRGYKNVSIKDLHQSWFDGMGLLALIDQYDNSLLRNNQINRFEEIDPSQKSENLDLAFNLAESHLGIPRLLDTQDILSTNTSQIPNEECFMTYLSFFPMAFLDKEQGRTPSTTTSTSATTTTTPTTRSTTTPATKSTMGGERKQGAAGSRIGGQQPLQQQGQQRQQQPQQKGLAVPRPPSPPPASKVEQARQLTPSTLKHTSIPIVTAPLSEQPVTSTHQQQGQQWGQQRGQQQRQPLQQQSRKVSPPRPPAPPPPAPKVPESHQITRETLASIVLTTPMEDTEEAKRIEEAKHPSAAAGGGRISPRKQRGQQQQPQRGPRAGARLAAGEGGVVGQEGKKGGLLKKKKMAKKERISPPSARAATTTPSATTTTTTTSTTTSTSQRGGLKPGFLLGKRAVPKEESGVAPVVEEEEQPVIGEATVFEIGKLPDRTELHEQRRQEKLERKRRKELEREVMTDHLFAPSEEQQPLQQPMERGVSVREGGLAPQLSPMGKKQMSGGIAPAVVGGAVHPRTQRQQQQQRPIKETGERGVAPVVEEEQPIGEATVFEIGRIPDITELHEQRRKEKLERKRQKRLEREVMTDHLFAPSEEQQALRETGERGGVEQPIIGEATVFEIGRIPDITEIHEQRRKEKLERKRRKELEREVMTDHLFAPSEEQQQPLQRAQQMQGVLGQKREMEREMFVTRRPQSLEEIQADVERIRREARVADEESRRIEAENEALRRQQPLLQQPLYGREGVSSSDAAVEAERNRIAYLKSYLAGLQSQTGLDPSRAALGDQQIRAELDEALLAKKRAKAERGRARREAAEAEIERHRQEQRRIQAEKEKLRAEAERLRAEEEKARVEGQFLARTLERLHSQAAQPSNISAVTPLPLAETTSVTPTTTTTTTTPMSLKGKEKVREGVVEETGAAGKYLPESEARKAQGIRDTPAVGQII